MYMFLGDIYKCDGEIQYTVISCLFREQSKLLTRGAGDDLRTVALGRSQQFPSHLQHRMTIVLTVP